MNKACKLLFALLISLPGMAQNSDSAKWHRFSNLYDNAYKKFEAKEIVGFQTNTLISSNRITNDFIYPFALRKNLEKKAIDNTLDNTKSKQLNIETNNELIYINLKNNVFRDTTLHWYIKTGTHYRNNTNISNGGMQLIFKGNTNSTPYDFSNCSYYNLRLSKMGVGIYKQVEKIARPYNLSFGLYVLQANNYGNVKTFEKNYLQGNEDSLEIGLNYTAEFANNGLGAGSEFIFNQKISDKRTWGVRLENFGFARFKEKTTTYNGNGVFNFDGIFIADIGRVTEDDYFKNQLDSFTNPLMNKKENQTKTIFIAPVSFIYYNVHLKSGYYQLGLRHSGTKALLVAEFRYFTFIKSKLLLGASLGTIGQYYLNTDINWAISRKWFLQAGLYHIEALALPKTFGGLGGNFGLQFVF